MKFARFIVAAAVLWVAAWGCTAPPETGPAEGAAAECKCPSGCTCAHCSGDANAKCACQG